MESGPVRAGGAGRGPVGRRPSSRPRPLPLPEAPPPPPGRLPGGEESRPRPRPCPCPRPRPCPLFRAEGLYRPRPRSSALAGSCTNGPRPPDAGPSTPLHASALSASVDGPWRPLGRGGREGPAAKRAHSPRSCGGATMLRGSWGDGDGRMRFDRQAKSINIIILFSFVYPYY